jgi:hypothetical protein
VRLLWDDAQGAQNQWVERRRDAADDAKGRDMRISPALGAAASGLDQLGVLTEGSRGELLQAM